MVRYLLCAAVLLTMTLFSESASACSCQFQGSPAEIVAKSDVIFYGYAESARLLNDEESPEATYPSFNGIASFRTYRAVKGAEDDSIVEAYFWASGSSCDYPVAVGAQGFVFLIEKNGKNFFGQCIQPTNFWARKEDYLDIFENEYGVSFDEMR
jgi:hypothetical protein